MKTMSREAYLEVLEKSIEHHEDGVGRTEENYLNFPIGSNHCALCQLHRKENGKIDCYRPEKCFLRDDSDSCCSDWEKAAE